MVVVWIALGVNAVVDGILLIVEVDRAQFIYHARMGEPADAWFPWVEPLALPAGALGLILFFVNLPLGLGWFYATYNNLFILEVRGLSGSPGRAIATCFAPSRWYSRAHQILQEIWRASNPDLPPDSDAWLTEAGSWLIRLWWGFFLARHLRISIVVMPFPFQNKLLLDVMLGASVLTSLACISSIVAAGLFCVIMQRVLERQWRRYELLQGL